MAGEGIRRYPAHSLGACDVCPIALPCAVRPGVEARGDPLDLGVAVLVRNLIFATLGVLALMAVYLASPRSAGDPESIEGFVEELREAGFLDTDKPALQAVATALSAPMITEQRFVEDPGVLTQVVSAFPRDYRILSYGREGAHGLWQVRYERPEPTAPAPVESELRRYLAGQLEGGALRIDYREIHLSEAARQGAHIVVFGTGELRENVLRSGPGVQMAALYAVEELVELLIELEAWQQYILIEQPTETGYSMATLEITAGSASSRIWELPRHRTLDDRLTRIADRMRQLAWVDDHIVILRDE